MTESISVLLKIAVMFLVMVTGWWASRREYLTPILTKALSVLVVELTFPCLIVGQMLSTVSPAALKRGWWVPLFALVSIMIAVWVGRAFAPVFGAGNSRRRTFAFLVGIPNWVFLPLPIVEGLYGAAGVRFVLLYNLGAQIVLWSIGIRVLQGSRTGVSLWRALLTNPGIIATLGGAAVALVWPGAASFGQSQQGLIGMTGIGLMGALKMVGDLTIPLSLLATGAQLGFMIKGSQFHWRPLAGINFGRLIVAPVVTLLLMKGIMVLTGISLTEAEFMSAVIIVAMPVAISCTMFAERFGGDGELSASAIFSTTLFSLGTVPLAVLASHWLFRL